MPTTFDRDIAVRPLGEGSYEGNVAERTWDAGAGPNGGYLGAIVLNALAAAVGEGDWHPRTLTVHYLRPPAPGPLQIATAVERAGRRVSSLSARATQEGKPVAAALAAFALPREEHLALSTPPPPGLPFDPERIIGGQEHDRWPPIFARMLYAPAFGAPPLSGAERAEVGSWMRLAEPRPLDPAALVLFADGSPPALFSTLSAPMPVPTIELTVHFRARLPLADLAEDAFVLSRARTRTVSEGFMEEDVEIWAPDGQLLAQSRQLALAG